MEDAEASSAPSAAREGIRRILLLLVVPCVLLGPIAVAGERFLPWLPVGLEPLRSEDPEAGRAAFEGANHVQGDRIFPVLTDQLAMREELAGGSLPTWEPLFGLGVPLFAGSIAAAAYPPNWVSFVLPPERAAGVLALTSLFLAGLGTWLFLRRLGLAPGAAAIGVLAVQLGGWGIGNLYYFMKVDAALWLPWSLWAVEGIARDKRWSGLALTLSVSLALLAGFVPIALFGLAVTGLYALVRLFGWYEPRSGPTEPDGESRFPRLAALALFLVLGLAAAAVQLLPTAEASRQSLRADRTVADLTAESLPGLTIVGTIVPDFVGSPTEDTPAGMLPVAWWITPADDWEKAEVANQLEWNAYAGAVVVLLSLVALIVRPRRAAFPALALLGVFAFAQGWPLVRWAYALPGLDIGAPGRALAVAWVLWPWLAALGAQAVLERAPRALGSLLSASFMLCAVAFLSWNGFDPERWATQLQELLVERYGEAHGLAEIQARVPPELALAAGTRLSDSLGQVFAASLSCLAAAVLVLLFGRPRPSFVRGVPGWVMLAGSALVGVLAIAPVAERGFVGGFAAAPALLAGIAALGIGGATWRRREGGEIAAWLPFAIAIVVEGFVAASGHAGARPEEAGPTFPRSTAIEAVREAAGDGRVVRYDPSASGVEHVVNLARPNMLEAYGIADLTPYTVFTPRTLIDLFEAIDPATRYGSGVSSLRSLGQLGHPVLDLLRVQAVIARDPIEHPRLEPVLEQPGFHVYRRRGALPPCRVVPGVVPAASDEAAVQTLETGVLDFDLRAIASPGAALELPPPAVQHAPGEIDVERPARNRFDVAIRGSTGGLLVMHEQYYPGWKARVNDEPAEIVRVDHVYRGVVVPAGDSTVETWYAPASLTLGAVCSAAAIVAAFLLSRRFAR